MSDSSETSALVARAQEGDVRAFEALVAAHIGQVRRFARAFAHDDDDAADLAQEALVKVYRSIRGYRFQSAFSTWLFAITRNVFLDATKSRATKERTATDALDAKHLGAAEEPLADEQIAREQERRLLWAAIEKVPPEFRTVVVLFDIEGLAYEEIAAIERVALGTVKSRLSRGRDHLRRILGASEGPPRGAGNPETDSLVIRKEGAET